MDITLKKLKTIRNHGPVRAVVEVEYGGLLIRGLKLEEHEGQYRLEAAGRKISGGWELVYQLNEDLEARMREHVVEEYLHRRTRWASVVHERPVAVAPPVVAERAPRRSRSRRRRRASAALRSA